MKMITALFLALIFIGCAPMTQQAIEKRDDRAYDQMVREQDFYVYKEDCESNGGYAKIERMGYATRRNEIRNVPGRRDRLHCIGRIH